MLAQRWKYFGRIAQIDVLEEMWIDFLFESLLILNPVIKTDFLHGIQQNILMEINGFYAEIK
jgi:hypothetical protein